MLSSPDIGEAGGLQGGMEVGRTCMEVEWRQPVAASVDLRCSPSFCYLLSLSQCGRQGRSTR